MRKLLVALTALLLSLPLLADVHPVALHPSSRLPLPCSGSASVHPGCVGGGSTSTLLDGLTAAWGLGEVTGATRLDWVGTNDLSDHGSVSQVAGKVGNAANFIPASAQYLSHISNAALQTGDIDFTISTWVYFAGTSGNVGIINKYGAANADKEYRLFAASGVLTFQWLRDAIGTHLQVTGPTLNPTTWYHVLAWRDSTTDKIYVQVDNGTIYESAAGAGGNAGAAAFELGSQAEGGVSPMNGNLDATKLWKRLLTAAERVEDYNGGTGIEPPF